MRKQVTFVEQPSKGKVADDGHMTARCSTSSQRRTDGGEFVPPRLSEMHRGTNRNVCAGSRYMQTLRIPKPLVAAPFLQHPGLTVGQRRYLCSIASVYSTEHMRQQMKRHYLNLLHTCIEQGQSPPCRRRNRPHQCRGDVKDAGMDVTRTKPQGRKKDGSGTADSGVKLPKIVNR